MKVKPIIIENKKEYVTKYGTDFLNENPSVIYLRSKIKITPKIQKNSFETEVQNLKNELTQSIANEILNNTSFSNRHLLTIDLSAKSVAYKKISYMRIDLYLKPIIPKPLLENQQIVTDLSNHIKNNLFALLEKYNLKCSVKNK